MFYTFFFETIKQQPTIKAVGAVVDPLLPPF